MDIQAPLTSAVFSTLLALATGDTHGYAIMKQVRQDANGNVKMGNGTLYGSLKRMLADGLIAAPATASIPSWTTSGGAITGLTDLGRRALSAEMQRYVEIALLRRRNLLALASAEGGG